MQARNGDSWKPEEEAVLRELSAKGKTALQIGLRLRRSQSGVKKRAITLGLELGRTKHLSSSGRYSHRR
jgi:DNA-binding NarL/FixJ family response regulator